eukprot:4523963-Prymnesium_polylepis.1
MANSACDMKSSAATSNPSVTSPTAAPAASATPDAFLGSAPEVFGVASLPSPACSRSRGSNRGVSLSNTADRRGIARTPGWWRAPSIRWPPPTRPESTAAAK